MVRVMRKVSMKLTTILAEIGMIIATGLQSEEAETEMSETIIETMIDETVVAIVAMTMEERGTAMSGKISEAEIKGLKEARGSLVVYGKKTLEKV